MWFDWQLHLPSAEKEEGGCERKWLGQQQAEHGKRMGWFGWLGKSCSANDVRCEDLRRLGSAGKKG